MRTYLKLKCPVCKRTKDELVNTTHFSIPKCTITLGCTGIMQPMQYSDYGDTTIGTPPVGAQNWYSRFQQVTRFTSKEVNYIPLSIGKDSVLMMAVADSAIDFSTDTITVNCLIEQSTPRDFLEYTFNFTTTFDKVMGAENGNLAKKVLRFSSSNVVKVFLDGEEFTEGTGDTNFQIARTGNTLTANTIFFNKTFSGDHQVKVVITKPVQQTNTPIEFHRNHNAVTLATAWNDVETVVIDGQRYSLFYSIFHQSVIPAGKQMQVNTVLASVSGTLDNAAINLQNCVFLLSSGPTKLDRGLTSSVPLAKLESNELKLLVVEMENVKALTIPEEAVSSVFPYMTAITFGAEPILKASTASGVDFVIDNSYILGPNI